MTERSISHATFVVERTYDATPQRIFAAWASPEAKARWFMNPEGNWEPIGHELDFQVGGDERLSGRYEGMEITFSARYQDIVADERIVYTYEMSIDGNRISVSLGSIVLKPVDATKTKLVYTEQGAFLDGLDSPVEREEGTQQLLDNLGRELARDPSAD